ncbi:MAG: DUF805 domain-containing protein [Alphaproteobacteria bacterium]|nr:DUF805 domain-containing protein [Alphaproteobacteria bacterium]MBU1562995.1 DUF805 domain-containing protein [Alphaproteobacteria bacterium]MBU2304190.1 DUF805 domain-containing protein [Alphaproteobacteria bacterium]MBU2368190.1 DUF805 domain-containing protein [Alphaproteobacteria bacterium]
MDKLKVLYTTTEGRLSRKEWWIGVVGLIIASIVLSIILGMVGLGGASGWGQLIAYVILFYPGWCIGIKRRQDRDNNATDFKVLMGLSGLLTLLQAFGIGVTMTDMGNGIVMPTPDMWMSVLYLLLGIFGIYMLVQLGFLRGTPGPNSYGPDPLGYAAA